MNMKMLSYIDRPSPIQKMTGASKLLCLILWSVTGMTTYDTRILLVMLIIGAIVFRLSKVKFREISFALAFILFFLVMNDLAIYAFAPGQGQSIYGTSHIILHLPGWYTLTWEQLFYEFNITLKYIAILPFALVFIVTTQPSEFAASLTKIGVSYRIAYSVSITLRYIPDIQREYREISLAQQSRGIDLSRKAKLSQRISHASAILIPLIFSSIDRIETISNGMELRGFGKKKKRTWYSARSFADSDYLAVVFSALIFVASIFLGFYQGSRYFNPFK
ncbi:MAG: energy-coupling factor transporter transmembrane protein EcfT [Sporolactobacillus sp.]